MTSGAGKRRGMRIAATVAFGAWAAFVMYAYFAQFSPYLSALWRKLPW